MFTPFRLRDMVLANRVVMSPMCQYSAKDGTINDWHLVHIGSRAIGGAALVMTEMTDVSEEARITPGCAGLYKKEHVTAWQRVTRFVHDNSYAKIGIQLAHAGRKGSTKLAWQGIDRPLDSGNWPIMAASPLPYLEGVSAIPREMTRKDMDKVRDDFVRSATMADEAGFDVIELHFAHGYLLASFLSPISNTRSDAYGGDRAGRMRFALEVTRAVRAAWPAGKPLFFRVSALDGGGGWDMPDTVALAHELKTLGVDVVDCSSGGVTGTATAAPIPRYPGFQVPYASEVRRTAGVATMAVGLILDGPQAEAILQGGHADLVAIGRQALYDPFWALHAAEALGCDPDFSMWPSEIGWWLEKRSKTLQTGARTQ
jgi:anthraniloyl-CoA monooxygenase